MNKVVVKLLCKKVVGCVISKERTYRCFRLLFAARMPVFRQKNTALVVLYSAFFR